MEKTITVHFGYLAGAIISGAIAIFTATGEVQEHIQFAGVANEMGFFFFAIMLSGLCLISSFSKPSNRK